MTRFGLAVPVGVLVMMVATGCSSLAAGSEYVGVMDELAVETCGLLFGGMLNEDLVGAVDSTIGEVRTISVGSGLDPADDPNLNDARETDYAALCLVPVDGKRYVFYQLEDAARSGAISRY